MFREMRRKEKRMPEADAIKIIREAEYGTLATIGQDDYPYASPLNFVYDNEHAIYFHTAHEGHKLSNIACCNHVCFSVVGRHKLIADKFDTEYDSVVIFGKAYRIENEDEKRNALMLLIEKYSNHYRTQGAEHIDRVSSSVAVYKIQIEHMTGKIGR